MKPPKLLLLLLASTLVISLRAESTAWRTLFNGRDLSGWETYLATPHPSVKYPGEVRGAQGAHAGPVGIGRDPTGVFSVVSKDGKPAIRISGQIFGGLATLDSFTNYHLRMEMRWGELRWRSDRPRDGGFCIIRTKPGGTWESLMPSFEYQIQENDMGDFWAINTAAMIPARRLPSGDWIFDDAAGLQSFSQPGSPRRCRRGTDGLEHPIGSWNVIELVCLGDESWHLVNGTIVMHLQQLKKRVGDAWVRAEAGRIQIQSEGAELFVRAIQVRPIRDRSDFPSIASPRQ
ncbi:MAG: DUF1080 domain-containing protein [Bryobacterales bacterium]|nr:DUF1080 domain-containing protein [Bryobacterales bacterium]